MGSELISLLQGRADLHPWASALLGGQLRSAAREALEELREHAREMVRVSLPTASAVVIETLLKFHQTFLLHEKDLGLGETLGEGFQVTFRALLHATSAVAWSPDSDLTVALKSCYAAMLPSDKACVARRAWGWHGSSGG